MISSEDLLCAAKAAASRWQSGNLAMEQSGAVQRSALFWLHFILYKKLVFKSKHLHVLLFQLQFEAKQCLSLANRLESNLPLLPQPHPKSALDFTRVSRCKND